MLVLVAGGLSWWQCGDDEPAPAPAAAAGDVSVRDEGLEPPPLDAGADAAVAEQAPAAPVQAPPRPPPQPAKPAPTADELEAYIRRWREALEPLLNPRSRQPAPVKIVRSEPEAKLKPPAPCEPGTLALELLKTQLVDHVVAVDTSGSMYGGGLKAAADFLGRLEYGLAAEGREYRLLVLAEPQRLLVVDAGVLRGAVVASHDGVDVMLASAFDQPPGWGRLLRPGSEVRLVLVSDDRPLFTDVTAAVARLAAVTEGHRFTFSVVGGFSTTLDRPLLGPEDPPAAGRCREEGVFGVNEGLAYQRLASATGGSRASLCSTASRSALASTLVAEGQAVELCSWPLPPGIRPVEVRATGRLGTDYLQSEYAPANCAQMRRSYLLEPGALTLCPTTCASLKTDRFVSVQVRYECR